MGNGKNETEPKKGLWAMLKESMAKTSSGCGPGCGCMPNEFEKKVRQDNTTAQSEKGNDR